MNKELEEERETIVNLVKAHRHDFHGFLKEFDKHVINGKRVEAKVDTIHSGVEEMSENVSYLKELSTISGVLKDMKNAFTTEIDNRVLNKDLESSKQNRKSVPLSVFIIAIISIALIETIITLHLSGYSLEIGGKYPIKIVKTNNSADSTQKQGINKP